MHQQLQPVYFEMDRFHHIIVFLDGKVPPHHCSFEDRHDRDQNPSKASTCMTAFILVSFQ